MVTIARATHPFGPFESCPQNPVLTHRSLMNTVTSTGHADFFCDHHGRWWTVFLGIRHAEHGFHPLGRETFLAPVEWTTEGWPIVNGGAKVVEQMEVARDFTPHPWPSAPAREAFDCGALPSHWICLRNPDPTGFSLFRRPGWLTLSCGATTLDDRASPSAIFRRLQHFEAKASTLLEFAPDTIDEEAGLTALLDDRHHAELVITQRDGRRVALVRRRIGSLSGESPPLPVPDGALELALAIDRRACVFSVRTPGHPAQEVGRHELRYLCTEVAGGYTGVMLGLFAAARGQPSTNAASFAWFEYAPSTQCP
jgi:alpha-N-arabinofuranosidase